MEIKHKMAQLWQYLKITLNLGLFFKKILLLRIKQRLESLFINFKDKIELYFKEKLIKIIFIIIIILKVLQDLYILLIILNFKIGKNTHLLTIV